MMKILGSLCIISAPSGTGKTTLIQAVQNNNCFIYNTHLSISYTTRTQRFGETYGKEYYFVSKKKFLSMIRKNMFFEYAKIFGYYYGTGKSNINFMLNSGKHVILNVDWQGARQIKNIISNVYTIFILPPSIKELETRLRIRGKDTNNIITNRMVKSINEIAHFKEYDYIIVNDNFDVALKHLQSIILSEQLRLIHQHKLHDNLINDLLSLNF